MKPQIRVLLILLGIFSKHGMKSEAIKCYNNMESGKDSNEAGECDDLSDHAGNVIDELGSWWKWGKDKVQDISGSDFIDKVGEKILEATGIDVTSHEQNRDWIQKVLEKVGVSSIDVSRNCWITTNKRDQSTVARGCGALGKAGTLGAQVLKWIQGEKFDFWANKVCFTVPGKSEQEVCMCNSDNCNMNAATARTANGFPIRGEMLKCGDKECPMTDLKSINPEFDFSSACYKRDGERGEHCLNTDILMHPQFARMTKANNYVAEGFSLTTRGTASTGSRVYLGLLFSLLIVLVLAR